VNGYLPEVANGYLPSNELRGIQIAKLLGDWSEMEEGGPQSIWGSLSKAKNYYLSLHTDKDFFII
jgi:hypothetical protein